MTFNEANKGKTSEPEAPGKTAPGEAKSSRFSMADMSMDAVRGGMSRYQYVPLPLKIIVIILSSFSIVLFMFYNFGWNIRGWLFDPAKYYYLLYACLFSCVFVMLPFRKKQKHIRHVPWYDIALAVVVFGICLYFSFNSWSIIFYNSKKKI